MPMPQASPEPSPNSPSTANEPIASPLRGQAAVNINGRQVIFTLTLGALADLAQAFGTRNNFQLFARLQGDIVETIGENGEKLMGASGPSMSDLPAIVSALSNRAVTMDEARALQFADFQSVMAGIGHAIAAAFPERDEKKSADAIPTATMTAISPSTAISDSPSPT